MRISDWSSDVCSSDLGAGETHGLFGSSGASLHTKAFVIDGERGFIGSFNLDPRSAYLNTEMGVLFEDDDIARALREEYLFLAGPALSYEVCRDEAGELCWLDRTEDPPLVLHEEPQTTFLQIGRAHVCTPVTNANLVCRLRLQKKNTIR